MKKQNILTIYALLLACFLGVWGCDDDNVLSCKLPWVFPLPGPRQK